MTTAYDATTIWLIVLVAGIGTFALRLSFILLLGRLDAVPPTLEGVLRFVPAAVLAALVAPAIVSVTADPAPALAYETEKVVAGGIAAVVAWRTGNVLATIGVGMVVLWTLGALL